MGGRSSEARRNPTPIGLIADCFCLGFLPATQPNQLEPSRTARNTIGFVGFLLVPARLVRWLRRSRCTFSPIAKISRILLQQQNFLNALLWRPKKPHAAAAPKTEHGHCSWTIPQLHAQPAPVFAPSIRCSQRPNPSSGLLRRGHLQRSAAAAAELHEQGLH